METILNTILTPLPAWLALALSVVDAIPGKISGVDLSVPYKDYAEIIAKKGLTRLREGA